MCVCACAAGGAPPPLPPVRLRHPVAEVPRVCGDGDAILHSLRYSLIKRQRAVKAEGGDPAAMLQVRGGSCLVAFGSGIAHESSWVVGCV
ncbi:MAG: hypothetical protein P4L40_15455 [Terracidiphilus sp.]|nr:hypothetical protein [Terracidiphilus sp.]